MNGIVAFVLRHRVLMVLLFVIILVGGIVAFRELKHDAGADGHSHHASRAHSLVLPPGSAAGTAAGGSRAGGVTAVAVSLSGSCA
jgi:hypothetical protein